MVWTVPSLDLRRLPEELESANSGVFTSAQGQTLMDAEDILLLGVVGAVGYYAYHVYAQNSVPQVTITIGGSPITTPNPYSYSQQQAQQLYQSLTSVYPASLAQSVYEQIMNGDQSALAEAQAALAKSKSGGGESTMSTVASAAGTAATIAAMLL
jgi:hypothetical protein